MEMAKKHFSKGYDILCMISVSGENVERLALAKQEFRAGYAVLEKAQKAAEDAKKSEKAEVSADG